MAMVVSRLRRPSLGAPPPEIAAPEDGADQAPPAPPSDEPPPTGPDPRGPLGRMPVAGLSRRSAAFVIGAIVVVWIVFVFARAVAETASSSDQADRLHRQAAVAAKRLQAVEQELAIVQSADYLALQARAYGFGRSGEQAFALEPDSPSPRPITPLGAAPGTSGRSTPLEDWLELLFGP